MLLKSGNEDKIEGKGKNSFKKRPVEIGVISY